jgi:Putative MetA-pathway of phenol degradation
LACLPLLTVVIFFCYLEKMKKYHFFLFFLSFVVVRPANCLDLKGFQPIPPYGIFSTFSADSLEKGKMGIALTSEKSLAPDFYRFTVLFAFGVYDNLEIGMTVPYVVDWRHETDGFEDISFGIKYRFLDEGKYGPAAALLIFGSPPTGRQEFSTEGNYGGGFILSKKIGPVWGHANLFYSRPGTERFNDDITFAGGIDFSASHNVNFLAEIYGKKSYSGSLDRLEPRFGYRMRMGENFYTTIGAGLDIKNRSPEFRLLLTLSYFITPSEKKIRKIEEVDD